MNNENDHLKKITNLLQLIVWLLIMVIGLMIYQFFPGIHNYVRSLSRGAYTAVFLLLMIFIFSYLVTIGKGNQSEDPN